MNLVFYSSLFSNVLISAIELYKFPLLIDNLSNNVIIRFKNIEIIIIIHNVKIF